MVDRSRQWFRRVAFACGSLAMVAAAAATESVTGLVTESVTESHFHGFAPRVTLNVEHEAHSVIADDVNGDGKLDLIVAVAGANSVAVFSGHGDGTFDPPVYWPTGALPKFAVTADFNHDGHRDIVTADQDGKSISILLGNGDGTFRPKVSYPACNGDHEVAVADFDKDGNEDVVVACHGKPYFASVFFGKGDGTFRPRLDVTPGAEPAAVVIGDFNGDGIPDLAFANHSGNSVAVLLSKGDGTFSEPVAFATGLSPHAIRAGDLDGDGFLDLVTANDEANSVTVLFGTGDGKFGRRLDLPTNSTPKSVAVADVDGDGHKDIVVTNTTYPTCCTVAGSTISVFINRGDGTFLPRQDFDAGGDPFSLLVRDLNGDGKADVVTANFIDQAPAQRVYLDVVRKLGVSSRIAKAGGLGVCLLAGLLAAAILRSRSTRAAVASGVLITLLLAAGLWNASRPRTAGGSHISIFYGR
jgi:hypothetical protein